MQLVWAIKYLRFEVQRHRVAVVLNLCILLLVALAMHALMRGNGLWDDLDGKHSAALFAQIALYLVFILSALAVVVFAFLFGKKDRENANIYHLKLSPRSTYALQFLRFAFFFVSLCIYVLLLITMALLMPLPADLRSFYGFLFTAGFYLLFAVLLPLVACIFLAVEINNAYTKGNKTMIVLQAMGLSAFWLYLLPIYGWGMLTSINFLPTIPLSLPPIEWEVPTQFKHMSMNLALEPVLIAMLFATACIYLAARVVKETEV